EVIPDHDTITVTVIIKSIICHTTRPKTNHIIIHVFVQFYLRLVFFPVAPQQIFTHTPISTFQKYPLSVNKELENRPSRIVSNILVFILPYAERDFLLIGYLTINLTSQRARI